MYEELEIEFSQYRSELIIISKVVLNKFVVGRREVINE
jgi:hypothetical protein